MNQLWEDIINGLLGVALYHGKLPDDETWVKQYEHEAQNMMEDIKNFHKSIKSAGLEVSNEAMAMFLIYSEFEHIGNNHLIKKADVDRNTLLFFASKINDELNNDL